MPRRAARPDPRLRELRRETGLRRLPARVLAVVRRRHRRGRTTFAVSALVVIVVGAVLGWSVHTGRTLFVVYGRLQVQTASVQVGSDGGCVGTGVYGSFRAGAPVEVSNAVGTVVATSSLDKGTRDAGGCTFAFVVREIPRRTDSYSVDIAHSGPVHYSPRVLSSRRRIVITVGDGT